MDHEEIRKFIVDKGYRSKSEILEQFADCDRELLDTNLHYLVGKNQVRKMKVASGEKTEELFYIPA